MIPSHGTVQTELADGVASYIARGCIQLLWHHCAPAEHLQIPPTSLKVALMSMCAMGLPGQAFSHSCAVRVGVCKGTRVRANCGVLLCMAHRTQSNRTRHSERKKSEQDGECGVSIVRVCVHSKLALRVNTHAAAGVQDEAKQTRTSSTLVAHLRSCIASLGSVSSNPIRSVFNLIQYPPACDDADGDGAGRPGFQLSKQESNRFIKKKKAIFFPASAANASISKMERCCMCDKATNCLFVCQLCRIPRSVRV